MQIRYKMPFNNSVKFPPPGLRYVYGDRTILNQESPSVEFTSYPAPLAKTVILKKTGNEQDNITFTILEETITSITTSPLMHHMNSPVLLPYRKK